MAINLSVYAHAMYVCTCAGCCWCAYESAKSAAIQAKAAASSSKVVLCGLSMVCGEAHIMLLLLLHYINLLFLGSYVDTKSIANMCYRL